jgi:hypothetical protein
MSEKHARREYGMRLSAIAEGLVVGVKRGFFASSDTIFLG